MFIARATERIKQGESASPAERLDALIDALRIWPTLPGAEEKYLKAFEAEPTLDVGVTDVASPLGPWVHSRADARVIQLLYRPLLARTTRRPGRASGPVSSRRPSRRPTWAAG